MFVALTIHSFFEQFDKFFSLSVNVYIIYNDNYLDNLFIKHLSANISPSYKKSALNCKIEIASSE